MNWPLLQPIDFNLLSSGMLARNIGGTFLYQIFESPFHIHPALTYNTVMIKILLTIVS